MNKIDNYMDAISEYEIDSSWRVNFSEEYKEYRQNFALAKQQKYTGEFPVSIEIEASYHCNLKCPFCSRMVNWGELDIKHMSGDIWESILIEARKHGLRSLFMDHDGESLMNPRLPEMVKEASKAGIIDIWIHTNANLLTPELSEKLIDNGLTKINFSIDASTKETHEKLRIGSNYEKVIKNINEFLRLKSKKKAKYLRVRVSFVVQKENIQEKESFYEFWKNTRGVNVIAFQNLQELALFEKKDEDCGLSEKELEKKYAAEPPFHCSQPWENNIIDVDGNMIPCGVPVREHSKDFILGSLSNGDTIESCFNGEKMKSLRALHIKGEWYKNPMCRVCVKTVRNSENLPQTP